ncbi:glycosyltransferase family 4 protein [Nocardioides luteus]|uniref:glycosyltransferase family 4 protein n=1 Tax=Nocardioides luteus TaxID=1844 RepID=UPI001E42F11F|nr:glycosyltransferase family 4 protein [Nocardioides luteus]
MAVFSWRDTDNPEAGGAEHYLHQITAGLVEAGARVTVFTASYPGARAREERDGIRYVRRGGKLSIYLWGVLLLALGRLGPIGRVDAVIDVQNGLPFFTPLGTRAPVAVLVHHVHREQWPVVYPGLSGKIGWWVESRLAPRLYRRKQYIAVSRATRAELATLGVDPARVAVVHNGSAPALSDRPAKTEHPSICVVGRLVPHKRVELAVDAVVALRATHPDLRLTIVGGGWWADELAAYVSRVGADEFVELLGHVDEETKEAVYERSWLMALPSLKEGWGLVVTEAAQHGTPTVAFRGAGGTTESIDDGESGVLVEDQAGFVAALDHLLGDEIRRKELAEGARWHARKHTWEQSQLNFNAVLSSTLQGQIVSAD